MATMMLEIIGCIALVIACFTALPTIERWRQIAIRKAAEIEADTEAKYQAERRRLRELREGK